MANLGGMTGALVRDPRRWAVTWAGSRSTGWGLAFGSPASIPSLRWASGFPCYPLNLSIFSVGVRPILFGLALVEMARVVLPPLARWAAGSPGRSELLQRTAHIFALAIAAEPGDGRLRGPSEGLDGIAPSPGPMFRLSVVVAIVGATAFLIWLARVMTESGNRRWPAAPVRCALRRASAL